MATNQNAAFITAGALFQLMALDMFGQVKHLTQYQSRHFLNRQTNRLAANSNEFKLWLEGEGKEAYNEQCDPERIAQYSHIIIQLMKLDQHQRDLAESVINGLVKGEVMEFEQQQTDKNQ